MDPLMVGAIAVAALVVGYVLLAPKKMPPAIRASAPLKPFNAGRQFFDVVEEHAKDRAGAAMLDKLADARAGEHAALFGKAFAPPAAPAAPKE